MSDQIDILEENKIEVLEPRKKIKNMTQEENRERRRLAMRKYRDKHREEYCKQRSGYIKEYQKRPTFKEKNKQYANKYNRRVRLESRLFRELVKKNPNILTDANNISL